MTVLDQIRAATRSRHDNLECNAQIVERLMSPHARQEVMSALFCLYQQAELCLVPWLTPLADLDYERRRKLAHLAADLKALGVSPGQLPKGSPAPHLQGTAEALGFAYVLEGATLGGRVIRKRLARAGTPLEGTGFFDVYGAAAGARWKSFCEILERECSANSGAAVSGACAGFDFMQTGLMPVGGELGRQSWA